MKKFLQLSMMLSIALLGMTSCVSSIEELTEEKKETQLNLRVTQFDIIPFSTRAEHELSDYCKRIHYVVYNGTTVVQRIDQSSTDENFGSVSMSLAEGTYKVVVVAHSSSVDPTISSTTAAFAKNKISDIFFYADNLIVEGKVQNIDLELERATAMFRLITRDNVPAECGSIDIFTSRMTSIILDFATGLGSSIEDNKVSHDITEDEVGKPFQMEVFYLLNQSSKTISIEVTARQLDKMSILKKKTFGSVPMEKNKITQYSGYFFGEAPSGEGGGGTGSGGTGGDSSGEGGNHPFTISIASDWAGTNEYSF